MKSLQVVLVTGVAVLALGAAVVTAKYLATDSAEIESARSVIVDPKNDVIKYITAREEIPDMVTIRIKNVSLNSADNSADFSYNRFYKRNVDGQSRVSMDKVKGHLTFTYVIPSVISLEDNPAKRKFLVKTYEIKVLESQE